MIAWLLRSVGVISAIPSASASTDIQSGALIWVGQTSSLWLVLTTTYSELSIGQPSRPTPDIELSTAPARKMVAQSLCCM
ncbi:hypothetical protein IG631_22532 [Alternaria alternata]|nr:hypothetical protein IG631_22532 [Alternaria alternata]